MTQTFKRGQTEPETPPSGFTIIEVLIAIVILSYGLLAVASMQVSAMKANTLAARHTLQTKWAQHKLEELMALPFEHDDLKASGNPHQEATSDGYTITWNVADDDPVADTKKMTVTVSGKGSQTQVVSIKAS